MQFTCVCLHSAVCTQGHQMELCSLSPASTVALSKHHTTGALLHNVIAMLQKQQLKCYSVTKPLSWKDIIVIC